MPGFVAKKIKIVDVKEEKIEEKLKAETIEEKKEEDIKLKDDTVISNVILDEELLKQNN